MEKKNALVHVPHRSASYVTCKFGGFLGAPNIQDLISTV